MNATSSLARPTPIGRRFATLARAVAAGACLVLAACGGSADAPPPPETGPVLPMPPTITQQPADLTVTAGQSATFTVAATGTAPLSYQWQRNNVDIQGATSTTYTVPSTVIGDSGATFRAVVSNVAGSATSNNATLTVTVSAPVLTISPQPASTSVVAGATASFTVGGTCSSGTLDVQWQRNSGAQGAFVDIAGATAATYSVMTVMADSGAQFRAVLDCSGMSATPSNAATLTVTAPGSVTLSLLPLTGLRAQAKIGSATAVDQEASGTYAFITFNRIKRLSVDLLTIDLLAGDSSPGSADGDAATARFNGPRGITHDAAGNLYVADTGNHTIRRIAADGTVTTIAGSPGVSGSADGTGNAARFDTPWGIALGPDGDLYVADSGNDLIRRVTTAGVVTTYAGSTTGFLDGAPSTAQFRTPVGVAVAANGDVLVADASNNRVRRIVRSGNVAGSVETLAGTGTYSTTPPDGIGTAAGISDPIALYVRGNILYVREYIGLIRQIDLATKAVTTLAGSRTLGAGYADGPAAVARVRDSLGGITGAPSGAFITVDDVAVRLVSAAGEITTLAANASIGQTDTGVGTLPQQPFGLPINDFASLGVDSSGRVVVAELVTNEVRRIDATGAVTLAAGLTGSFGGVVDGKGSAAQFVDLGISLATSSTGVTYVGGSYGVRRIAADNTVTTLAGSSTAFGSVDGDAATARFNRIFGLAVGPNGDVFAADGGNDAVRRIDAAGNVTTYAGVIGQAASVDGPIATARLLDPRGVAFGPDGSLYVADGGRVRKISPDGSTVSTINAAGGLVQQITVDAADTLYYYDQAGLSMLPAGATTSTLLIPATSGNNVLGASPRLFSVQSMAMLGAKQIVIIAASQLLVATLP